MKKQAGSLIQNERGFTLLEVVVAVMIIGVVGTLVLQTVIKANTSMEISNVQTFMDNLTQSARESYKADPETVLFKEMDENIYPFANMPRTIESVNLDSNTDSSTEYTSVFTQIYSSNLSIIPLTIVDRDNDSSAKYKVIFTFTPKTKGVVAPGFEYKATEFEMNSKLLVRNKAGDEWKDEPLYDKDYFFDNISVKEQDLSNIKYATVKLDPVDGTIEPAGAATEFDIIIGSALGNKITQTAKKPGFIFKGWSKDKNSPGVSAPIIKSTEIITEDTTLYAKYLAANEYVVTYELNSNQTFNVPEINPNTKSVDMGLQTFTPNPKIKDAKTIDNKVDGGKMFANNVVSQSGKFFVGWQDVDGHQYTADTPIDPRYTILTPIMVDTKEEIIDLNLELDITGNNVKAVSSSGITTRNVLYPYANVIYEFYIDEGAPRVIGRVYQKDSAQTAIKAIGGDNALHPISKGIPEVVYDSKTDGGNVVFKDRDGKPYTTFKEYYEKSPEIKEALDKKANQLVINKTTLSVTYNGINMQSYTGYSGEKDGIKSKNGGQAISNENLNAVFSSNEKPIGSGKYTAESMKKVSDVILGMDKKIKSVNVQNTVDVKLKAKDSLNAETYMVGTENPGEKGRIYELNLVLPTGSLKYPVWNSTGNYIDIWWFDVDVAPNPKDNNRNWIRIGIRGRYATGNPAIGYPATGSDGWTWIAPTVDDRGNRIKINKIRLRADLYPSPLRFSANKNLKVPGLGAWDDNVTIDVISNKSPIYGNVSTRPGNSPYSQWPNAYVNWRDFSDFAIDYSGGWLSGAPQIYDDNLERCFKLMSYNSWENPGGYGTENMNYFYHHDSFNTGSSNKRSILTFAPGAGQNQVLPYWLVSTRKTS